MLEPWSSSYETTGGGGSVVLDNNGTISAMRVFVLVVDGVFDTGLATTLDVFAVANMLASGKAPFSVEVRGVRKRVLTEHGLRVPCEPIRPRSRAPDVVVVPAIDAKQPRPLDKALQRRDIADVVHLLQRWCGRARIAGACTGTYLLAASGILDGRRATTTWWLSADFRARFPDVALDESRMVVPDGPIVTAGAALGHVDLALWLVRQVSPSLARTTSNFLLFDDRPTQSSYAMADHLSYSDPIVERFDRWARGHLAGFTMAAAARAVGASERTLERRVHRVLGRSPIAYVRDLRVQQAIHWLQTTDRTVDDIATAVGYRDGTSLRTLLRTKTGRGVRELRARAG